MSINFTIDNLLADSCCSPDSDFDPTKSTEENNAAAEGWNIYTIELHCAEYRLSAKVIEEGVMDQDAGTWIVVPKYEIRSVKKVL